MGTGGNCGAQSSTMIIRGLALDEISPKEVLKVILKELSIALIIGLVLALVNALRVRIMYSSSEIMNELIWIVGLTLLATVIIAKILGAVLPIVAKVCKIDPAIMASPLITTIVDTCSVLIYFKIALMFIKL